MSDALRAVVLSDGHDAVALELEGGRVVAANLAARRRFAAAAPGAPLEAALPLDAGARLKAALAAPGPGVWESAPGAPFLVLPLGPGRHLVLALATDADATERLLALNTQLAALLGEQARLAADNARLLAEARRLAAAREALVAAVSHDLRNPLAAIAAAGAVVSARAAVGRDADGLARAADAIRRATRRMDALVQDLLDAEQIETGRLTLHPTAQPARPLVEEALEAVRAEAEPARVRTSAEPMAPGLAARCDRERVLRVLGNLLSNAVRFTPPGGSVTVGACRRGDDVLVEVTDTGPGVAPALEPCLFERGVTRGDGHGLGLFISRAFVEAHGGRIGVESRPGEGSRFWFTLPAA